jgi:hypothetical protein
VDERGIAAAPVEGGGNGQTLPYPTTTNLFQKKALFLENFPSFQTIFFVKEFMLFLGGWGGVGG